MGWEQRAVAAGIAWQQGQQQAAFAATADSRVPRGRECGNQQPSHVISSAAVSTRQSAAESHHQLRLPARDARGACNWRIAAGRWCYQLRCR